MPKARPKGKTQKTSSVFVRGGARCSRNVHSVNYFCKVEFGDV